MSKLTRRVQGLTDYGGFHRGAATYFEFAPTSLADAHAFLVDANQHGAPVRLRGSLHSMNGSALPRPRELSLSSSGLTQFRFERELTVTVGAGVSVWDVDQMLRSHGFALLLCNDGGAAASTTGGFVSAGGIGADGWRCGGFWETVEEIVLVTGAGEVMRCRPGDPLFAWVFGSMGQLGFVVEVTLRIRPLDGRHPVYPGGLVGQVERTASGWERNVWLTLFVPEGARERAGSQLASLAQRHQDAWTERESYEYFLRFVTFNPPLLYPRPENFFAVGIWGSTPPVRDERGLDGLRYLEADFAGLVESEPSYRRYVQSELTFETFDFATYFGKVVFTAFREHKRLCDPRFLLGRGSVFGATP